MHKGEGTLGYASWTQIKGRKKPTGIRDLINEALHREMMGLKSKVKQIKEFLLKPETQAKIRRELFEERLINNSNPANDVDFSKL
ncbi:hypothetical protein H8959_010361 [Pygathrix nigripes]